MPAPVTAERGPASPWDALLRPPRRLPVATVRQEGQGTWPGTRPGTKLALLLAALAEAGTATTLRLAVCTDLTPRQVWGLLKAPRSRGQVAFHAGRWHLVAGWHGTDVERAAALLRSRGWRVEPPAPAGRAV